MAEHRRDARDLADEWLNPIGAAVVGASNPGPSWQIKATGDFNGDGKSDILWQNTDGTPAIWLMNGTNPIGAAVVGASNPGPSWHVEGTGDFNGDGKSDILWQNDRRHAGDLDHGRHQRHRRRRPSQSGSDWHLV